MPEQSYAAQERTVRARRPQEWDAPVLARTTPRQTVFRPSRGLLVLNQSRQYGWPKPAREAVKERFFALLSLVRRRRWTETAQRASRHLGVHVTHGDLMWVWREGHLTLPDGKQLVVRYRSRSSTRVLIALA